jgi:hypothetical protein
MVWYWSYICEFLPERLKLSMTSEGIVSASSHFSWLDTLDNDDQATFLRQLRETLRDTTPGKLGALQQLLHEWRVTAQALEDPAAREVLLASRPEVVEWEEEELDLTAGWRQAAPHLWLTREVEDDGGSPRMFGRYEADVQINTGYPGHNPGVVTFLINLPLGWHEIIPGVQVRRGSNGSARVLVRRRVD